MLILLTFCRCRENRASTISLVKFVHERIRPFADVDEDRRSVTMVFLSDFIPPAVLSDVGSMNALGKVLAIDSLVL